MRRKPSPRRRFAMEHLEKMTALLRRVVGLRRVVEQVQAALYSLDADVRMVRDRMYEDYSLGTSERQKQLADDLRYFEPKPKGGKKKR